MVVDKTEATRLLQFLRTDDSGCFCDEEKTKLVEMVSNKLMCQGGGEAAEPSPEKQHGGQKNQNHDYSYNYYTDATWLFFGGDHSMRLKFKTLTKEWLKWGLRFPSAPTMRIGLATILVASNMDVTAQHAHALLMEFQTEFKACRETNLCTPTLKTFPARPEEFSSMFPNILENVVDCRVNVNSIRELSNKSHIPCRVNNRVIGKTPPKQIEKRDANENPKDTLLMTMLEMALGKRNIGATSGFSGSRAASPQPMLAISDRPSIDDEDEEPPETPKTDSCGRRNRLDDISKLVESHMKAKAGSAAPPKIKKMKSKKGEFGASTIGEAGSSSDSESEDVAAPHPKEDKKKPKTKIHRKVSKADFPKMSLGDSVEFMGGRLTHYANRRQFIVRMHPRATKQLFTYGKKGGRKEQQRQWMLGCEAIAKHNAS